MRSVPARGRAVLACAAGAVVLGGLLTACSGSAAAPPPWVSAAPFTLEPGAGPQVTPQGVAPTPSAGSSSGPAPSGSATSAPAGDDPDVVATKLNAPTGLVVLPDGTALVGERTTGRILRVQPAPHQPVVTVRTVSGLSTVGGGGLLDLALSPNYSENGLIYAYVTTATDNRVVDFTLTGPITPVFTGIPRGTSDNQGRIAFDGLGDLMVATGGAGLPGSAADPHSLAGKVLLLDSVGRPVGASPVYASGANGTSGLCLNPLDGSRFAIEPGTVRLVGQGATLGSAPLATLPATAGAVGGCAVQNGTLYIAALDGRALLVAALSSGSGTTGRPIVGAFTAQLVKRYGRLLTVVAAPDGALWLTTSNRDGHGHPVAADERVIRIVASGGGAGSQL